MRASTLDKVGNPAINQYPNNTEKDAFARTVWDMLLYNGRIYIASGDYYNNRGPIHVWSFDGEKFIDEYVVQEEQIDTFREYDGSLFIPGLDGKRDWRYGSIYQKKGAAWKDHRTVPGAFHIFDFAGYDGKWYCLCALPSREAKTSGISAVMESSDQGLSWQPVIMMDREKTASYFFGLASVNNGIIIMGYEGSQTVVYTLSQGNLTKFILPLFPNVVSHPMSTTGVASRLTKYKDGVLYLFAFYAHQLKYPSPLFFLSDPNQGARLISFFAKKNVRDIVVRGGNCYVLTAEPKGSAFQGDIYSSSDLSQWRQVATFSTSAIPVSLEFYKAFFYVGLAGDWPGRGKAYPEAGSIYRVILDEGFSTIFAPTPQPTILTVPQTLPVVSPAPTPQPTILTVPQTLPVVSPAPTPKPPEPTQIITVLPTPKPTPKPTTLPVITLPSPGITVLPTPKPTPKPTTLPVITYTPQPTVYTPPVIPQPTEQPWITTLPPWYITPTVTPPFSPQPTAYTPPVSPEPTAPYTLPPVLPTPGVTVYPEPTAIRPEIPPYTPLPPLPEVPEVPVLEKKPDMATALIIAGIIAIMLWR